MNEKALVAAKQFIAALEELNEPTLFGTDLKLFVPNNDKQAKIGDEIIFSSGLVLRLCSIQIEGNKKTIFLLNTKTGTIYRGKTLKGQQMTFKDFVVPFNTLLFNVNDLMEEFHIDTRRNGISKVKSI